MPLPQKNDSVPVLVVYSFLPRVVEVVVGEDHLRQRVQVLVQALAHDLDGMHVVCS